VVPASLFLTSREQSFLLAIQLQKYGQGKDAARHPSQTGGFMGIRKQLLQAMLTGGLILTTASAWQAPAAGESKATPADNTKVNQRDRSPGAVTADQQKMNRPDRETARLIRQSVYKDKSLSTYAHNVKIIVQNGSVTLKGPVRSEEEKNSVFSKATEVAGEGKVINQLSVAPEKK
jgi:hyperosmotically inducible protein